MDDEELEKVIEKPHTTKVNMTKLTNPLKTFSSVEKISKDGDL